MKVVSVGDILIDFTPIDTDCYGYPSIQANPGGDVANFLAAARKFGADTAFIGKVGDDTFGHLLINTLNTFGINTDGVVFDSTFFTTLGFVTLDASGERDFSFMHSADIHLNFDEINLSVLEDADVLHFSTVSMTAEPARSAIKQLIQYAKARNILISFDPNVRKSLWANLDDLKQQILWGLSVSDIVKISEDEIDFLYGLEPEQGMKRILADTDIQILYATCGAQGCYYSNRTAYGYCPALSDILIKDTVGAGDIFGGSAMWYFLNLGKNAYDLSENDMYGITRFATVSAGLSTTQQGGLTSVPSLDAIFQVL